MTELGFKEWLEEQERADEGVAGHIAGRIGGAALAALKNMGKMAARGGVNTLGGAANTALGVGQALIPGQRAAGASRLGRGLLQAGKGVGQLGLSGAPALAVAAGMPGADLAVGALAPHIGQTAAGMVPAAVKGLSWGLPPISPTLAAAKHMINGKGPEAEPGSVADTFGLDGWNRPGGEPPKPGFSNMMAALAKAKGGTTPPPVPTSAAKPAAAPATPDSAADKMLKMKYALLKAQGKPLPFEEVPQDELKAQKEYQGMIRKYHLGGKSTFNAAGIARLMELDKMAVEKKWPKVSLAGSDYTPGSLSKPKPPPLPATSPDPGPPAGSKAATVVGHSGKNTKEMSDDEIKQEMERRLKGGDKVTAEKLAHVLKRRAEKAVTPAEAGGDGTPATRRERLEWDDYTKLLSSKHPSDQRQAAIAYKMLRAKYPHIKWPKPPGGSKTLPEPTSSATTPV